MENLSRKWAKAHAATGYFPKVPTKTSRVEPVWCRKKTVRTPSQNPRVLPLAEVLHRPTYSGTCEVSTISYYKVVQENEATDRSQVLQGF